MFRQIKPSPAMVVALLALFVSLAGGAYAATNLPRNSVGTAQIRNGAVSNPKLANNSVSTPRIRNGAVNFAKLANNSVGTARIRNGAVNNSKLGGGVVQGRNLATHLLRPYIREASASIVPGTGTNLIAMCSRNDFVVGGGWWSPQTINKYSVARNQPFRPIGDPVPNRWIVGIDNDGHITAHVTAYAVCVAR